MGCIRRHRHDHNVFWCESVQHGDLSKWYVSSANDMSAMFSGVKAFNDDISQWDVSGVIDMSAMFSGVKAFNGDLSTIQVVRIQRK